MPIPAKKIKMTSILYSFYTYMGLKVVYEDTTKDKFDLASRAFNNKFEQLSPMVEKWIDDLAVSLRDYLAIISWGEARHAPSQTEYYIPEVWQCPRRKSYIMGSYYYPKQFLPILGDIFAEDWQSSSFGGEAWLNIVQAALAYYKMPSTIFVDHIMDIVHNGSTCFDKGVIVNLDFNPLNILDHKRDHFIWEYTSDHTSRTISIHPYIYDLYSSAKNLSIISQVDIRPYLVSEEKIVKPPRIKWGILNLPHPQPKDKISNYAFTKYNYESKMWIQELKERTKLLKNVKSSQLNLFKKEKTNVKKPKEVQIEEVSKRKGK